MKSTLPLLLLFVAVILEVISTTALKASNGYSNMGPTLVVIMGYAASFYFLSLVMQSLPVGITYALWSGMGIIMITLISAYVYKEVPDWPAMLGLGLIIAGIAVIQLFSDFANKG